MIAIVASLDTCLSWMAGYADSPTLHQTVALIGASGLAGSGVLLAAGTARIKKIL
jgi:hypothetical protein